MDLIPSNSSSSWSHEVSLFPSGNLECVGTIISSYLILTLASCLYGHRQNKLTIKTKGAKFEEEQIRNISQILLHPGFKNSSSKYDLAILVLDQELDTNPNSGVKVTPILEESTSMNFSGRLCRENAALSSLEISESSRCSSSSSSLGSDKLCLLPVKSNSNETNCGSPLPGSSLICSDEEHGQFLCGILATLPEKMGEKGRIYTNISSHSKWIQSTSVEATAKPKTTEQSDGDDYEVGQLDLDFADVPKDSEIEDVEYEAQLLNGVESGPISYQLSLRLYQNPSDDSKWEHICGAVILDESNAISAAHCFVNTKDESRYRVVAGENRLNVTDKKEQVLRLKKITIHPKYTDVTNGNDIAVLHMENFKSNKYAAGVWLSHFSTEQLTNKTAVISGWGKTKNTGGAANSLLKGDVSILPYADCLTRTKRWNFTVQQGVLCALDKKARTCRGDSGGPLVIQNYTLGNSVGNLLVGIVSVGATNCELENTAGGFTEISHFYDWIQENRAEKPCKPNHFSCITGGCYYSGWKCDKEQDCLDGTDEMNCDAKLETTSKTTAPCGGFINLNGETELIYKVPSEERQRDSICLWVVSTGRKDADASIQAMILDDSSAQFNPKFDIIYVAYNYTVSQSFYKTVNQVKQEYTVPRPFMTVYYRTNSSAPNAGFHLQLKDSITKSDITERLHPKLFTIPNENMKTGETREFSYPSSVSGASNYSSYERTFLILKPQKPGYKIRVNLKFVDTEEKYDWLEIGTHQIVPFIRKRFNGRGNWKEQILEGFEDEPLVFYFHSDKSNEGQGFKMEYSEILAPKPAACGGFIQLDGQQELLYKVPADLRGQKSVCVWVVASSRGSFIDTHVYTNPRASFSSDDSNLYGIFDLRIDGSSWKNILVKDDSHLIEDPFTVIYFRTYSSAPNSGFHIRLKEMGKNEMQKPVKYLALTADANSVQEFKYPPPPATNYTNDERSFVIVKPGSRHGKLKLDMRFVDTEKGYDWFDIVSLTPKPTAQFRFDGEGSWSNKSFVAQEDEPFIVFFHSDKSNTRSGFRFSYSEQKKATG